MAKAAYSPELKSAFEEHLTQTEGHARRLEQIFEELDEPAKGKKCKGMQGLIEEGSEMIKELKGQEEVLDAGLISAAQRVEHYEIAGYGTVRTYAELLGEDEAVRLLEETLGEEKETDDKLTELAQEINVQANEGEEGEEGEEEEEEGSRRKTTKRRTATA
jgi:ferritin-like metal-binding protein YciE